jgi:hypothetical protein
MGIKRIIKCFAAGLMIFGSIMPSFAEMDEFSAKVNGDIYGQVKIINDVDGDGKKDMIFGATDGKVHIFSASGKEIFRPPYWPSQVNGPITAGIEVTDIDGSGKMNVFVSTMEGTVYCLNSKGKTLWKYDTGGKILSSPPIVTDNGVLVNSGSGEVVQLNSSGQPQCIFKMDHAVQASPVPVDLDNDGIKEVIVKDNSGKVVVFDNTGGIKNSWMSASNMTNSQWPFAIDASDIDGDGIPEIFTTDPTGSTGVFKMWNDVGEEKTKFELTEASHGAPRIADMDGDGIDDIVIAQCDGKVIVCDKKGKLKKGWPYECGYSIYSAPSIIDLDGDGIPEIVFSGNNGSYTGDQAGCVIALNVEGKMLEGFPKYIGKTIAPLTFADLDGDGVLEIIAAGGIGYTGPQLHVFKTKTKPKFKIVTIRQQTTIK